MRLYRNSVTQADGNTFWEDVVLNNFYKASRDVDNISDQIYIYIICSNFHHDDFELYH